MLHVSVTQTHIDSGIRQNPWQCPVARAIKDALHDPDLEVSVATRHVTLYRSDIVVWRNDFQEDIIKWIAHFDQGLPISPFEFDLDINNVDSN